MITATPPVSFEAGIWQGVPAPHYHKVQAASASQLRVIHTETPAHLEYQRRNPKPPTWEMIFGTLVHHRLLEPGEPFPQLAIIPEKYPVPADATLVKKGGARAGDMVDWNPATKYCRQWGETMEAAGKIVVERKDLDEIEQSSERILENREARELLEGADTEVTIYWSMACGQRIKARLDAIPAAGGVLFDLKTCADASERGWQRHAWDLGYHLQAAWYKDLAELLTERRFTGFKFVAYERGVGLVKVHRCSPELIEAGRKAYTAALDTYIRCTNTGVWPGYTEEAAEWDVPTREKGGAR